MFPLHYIAEILRTASEDIGLINHVIKFHLAQHMRSALTNVTDRQMDRQTDGRHTTAIRSTAIAWSGKNQLITINQPLSNIFARNLTQQQRMAFGSQPHRHISLLRQKKIPAAAM